MYQDYRYFDITPLKQENVYQYKKKLQCFQKKEKSKYTNDLQKIKTLQKDKIFEYRNGIQGKQNSKKV